MAEQRQVVELCNVTSSRTENGGALTHTYLVATPLFPYSHIIYIYLLAAVVYSQNKASTRCRTRRRLGT